MFGDGRRGKLKQFSDLAEAQLTRKRGILAATATRLAFKCLQGREDAQTVWVREGGTDCEKMGKVLFRHFANQRNVSLFLRPVKSIATRLFGPKRTITRRVGNFGFDQVLLSSAAVAAAAVRNRSAGI